MQIHQFPALTELSSSDVFPVSHSNAVYKVAYSALLAEIAGKTSAAMYGNLATNTDLNTVTTAGVYQLSGANTYVNLPTGTQMWGVLEVVRAGQNSAYIYQRITGFRAHTYERVYANDSWAAWTEVTTGQLIQKGSTNGTTVTFSTEFASTPIVTLTPITTLGASPIVAMAQDVSATGFTIVKKYYGNGSWLDSSATIHWIAVGSRF